MYTDELLILFDGRKLEIRKQEQLSYWRKRREENDDIAKEKIRIYI